MAPQRYSIPDDFDIEGFAARSVSGIMDSGDVTRVVVRYSPVIAGAARADRVVRERTLTELPDGGIEIAYVVSDPSEFVRWAMKWGAEAEIVEPLAVRSAAVTLAREIVARYDG